MVFHQYKRELTHVNWITSFLVVTIAIGFISASHSPGPFHDCILEEGKEKMDQRLWINIAQDILLSCIIAISLLKLRWIHTTKPFGDKFFRCLFYTNLAIMSIFFASLTGHALVLTLNNLQNPPKSISSCDSTYTVFEWSAMTIKAIGVFLGLLEILSELENKIGYDKFVAEMRERCQQRVIELSSLDDTYFQATPEQFVRNVNKEILLESNMWAQLEIFLQKEFYRILFEINILHQRIPRSQDFVYIYCPNLSRWVIPQTVIDNSRDSDFLENLIHHDKRHSGPVAFVDIPSPIESY